MTDSEPATWPILSPAIPTGDDSLGGAPADGQRAGGYKGGGALDGLIEKITAVIQRLEEYRTAVITAAVTGKGKVDACFQPRCG